MGIFRLFHALHRDSLESIGWTSLLVILCQHPISTSTNVKIKCRSQNNSQFSARSRDSQAYSFSIRVILVISGNIDSLVVRLSGALLLQFYLTYCMLVLLFICLLVWQNMAMFRCVWGKSL